jgi:hypothetical protein
MRTKSKVLLSGVVAALSSASLMAQVYSLNAVGYINVTVPSGFSIMANQLNTTNNNISPLLDAQLGDGFHDGVQIYKYATVGGYTTFTVDSTSAPPYDGGNAAVTTLNPGEAVFIHNPFNTNFTLTFVGTVLQGSLTNHLLSGFNLVSSMVPQAGALDTALGITEIDGDQIYTYNSTNGYTSYTGDSTSAPPWDGGPGGAAPSVSVGQGFFYHAGSGAQLWIRTFTVN